jgi:purine-cytosine permease-like protein
MNMRTAFVRSRSCNRAVATSFVPELFVATGLALFVAAAVAFAVALALALALEEDDDEADALDVAPGPVTGPPAMLIALVVPN